MEFSDDQLDEATGDQKFDSMMSQMTAEPKYPDKDMPPTSVSELIQWAGRNNKPYHEYFAQWARRNKFTNVNDALVWFGDNVDPSNPWGPKDFVDPFGRPAAEELEDAAKHDPKAAELMKVFRCYEEIVFDWPDEYRQMNMPDSRKGTDEGVAEGLNEFAPDGFNGGDDDEGFSPEIAKMAQEDGFTKGVSLADGATLERAMTINHWHSQHGGMYKQYFAKGFKEGRMNKVNHDNKQYNLNLKLMKDGSIRHGEQGMAEGWTKLPSGDYQNSHTGVRTSKPPAKKKRGEKTGAEWDAIEKAKKEQGVEEGSDFDSAAFDRHMDKLRAQKELEKTDPMRAMVNKMKSDYDYTEKSKSKSKQDDERQITDPFHPSQGVNIGEHQWFDPGSLNELSPKTLGSYINKANKDVGTLGYGLGDIKARPGKYKDSPAIVKSVKHEFKNRIKGVEKAVNRLTKEQGVAEGAPISGDGGAVDNFKQQMANNTELAYQQKQQGMAEGSEEDSYSNKFVQSQIDYYKKHLLSGNTGDQHRIRGSLMNYERIKNQRIKNNTWQEQGVAEAILMI
jgi:hypothetical protein